MNNKCIICDKREYPILRKRRCVRCIARSNEDNYKRQNPYKPLRFHADYLVKEYILNKKSLQEISNECGITKQAIVYWLKYYEIPIRSISEALKKRINSEFFADLNLDSAFLLGYIFTDGDLQFNKNTGHYFLRLYGKYYDDLEMVLKLIKSRAKIQQRKAVLTDSIRQGKVYFIHIADEKFISDLMDLGMVRNKNSKVKFPEIPEELYSHFIRGCWAGSGYAYIDKDGKFVSGIVLASKSLLERIEQILNSAGLKKRKIYEYKHTKTPSFYFRYAREDSEKLYHYLIKGATVKNTIKHQSRAFSEYFKIASFKN